MSKNKVKKCSLQLLREGEAATSDTADPRDIHAHSVGQCLAQLLKLITSHRANMLVGLPNPHQSRQLREGDAERLLKRLKLDGFAQELVHTSRHASLSVLCKRISSHGNHDGL
jgi:hypothetical protein